MGISRVLCVSIGAPTISLRRSKAGLLWNSRPQWVHFMPRMIAEAEPMDSSLNGQLMKTDSPNMRTTNLSTRIVPLAAQFMHLEMNINV
jgi:hypothetical protein